MEHDHSRLSAWYEENSRQLTNHGLWLLGQEPNVPGPEEFERSKLRVLIARLSPYHEVSAGITHSLLFQLATAIPEVFVDFAYLPPLRDEKIFRSSGIPLWIGTTTKRSPLDFHIIAISNSVVQELMNLPALLHYSGIPLSGKNRVETGSPFLLLGGSNSQATSILHGKVRRNEDPGLVDGVLIGDGEKAFPAFLRLFLQNGKRPRNEFLASCRKNLPGFLDPGYFSREPPDQSYFEAIRASHEELERESIFVRGPIFYDEPSAGKSHLLISKGCPYFCSFCKESWEQKPYREAPQQELMGSAIELKRNLGLSEVTLMSFNPNTFSQIGRLLTDLDRVFHRVSLKSQRFDAISRTPQILERQIEAGKKTYTCAMEGISDRLRRLLQKNLDEETLLKGFSHLFSKNIRQMKIFLIVTGWEEKPDLLEFSGLLSQLQSLLNGIRGQPKLTFSLAVLFRPPFTPLQFLPPRSDIKPLEAALSEVSARIVRAGFEVRISSGPEDAIVSEYIAYSDPRHTFILTSASIDREMRYHGKIDSSTLEFWKSTMEKHQLAPQRNKDTTFPWDFLQKGVSKDFLRKNLQLLQSGKELQSCIAPPLGSGRCHECGGCPDSRGKKRETSHTVRLSTTQTPVGKRKNVARIRLIGEISERLAWVGNSFLEAAFARMIMLGKPEWTTSFLRFDQTLFRPGFSGTFIADLLFQNIEYPCPIDLDKINSYDKNLKVSELSLSGKSLEQDKPRMIARFIRPPDQIPTISRQIDRILSRYNLKHQKQWKGETLHWTLQPGHAKKTGFSIIRWTKDSSEVFVNIEGNIDQHFLEKLSGGGKRHFVSIR